MTNGELIALLREQPPDGEAYVAVDEDEDANRMRVLGARTTEHGVCITVESPVYFNWATLSWEPR